MLTTLLCATLAACGGGNGDTPSLPPASLVTMGGPAITNPSTVVLPEAESAAVSSPASKTTSSTIQGGTASVLSAGTAKISGLQTTITPAPATVVSFANITSVQLTSTATTPQINTPVTFGQVFKPGDVKNTEYLGAKTAAGTSVPLQVDVKARHPDGSLRHAVITAVLPSSMPKQIQAIYLVKDHAPASTAGTMPKQLLNAGFTSSFTATVDGKPYTASADALLASGNFTTWLNGPQVTEWLVSSPLKDASGQEHPHLAARFSIRYYPGSNSARVDVTVENDWAHEPSPQNFTYDAQITVGGKSLYTKAGLAHYHHARWRKIFWWGKEPLLTLKHNTAYLIATKALPNYDQTLAFQDATMATLKSNWLKDGGEPMTRGLAVAYMPTTGGRGDIGLLPSWAALYLLSQDPRAKDVTLGMSENAGSWSVHYRNKATGRPINLADYPYMTTYGSASTTYNPVTKKEEAFPTCPTTSCTNPLTADADHQPGFAYLPYLVTGDVYHLEELQFWANWNLIKIPTAYREAGKGLFNVNQIRAQAWDLRTMAEVAYISPDADPHKSLFTTLVNNNLDWFNSTYTNNASANKLGALIHSYALSYENGTGIAPWQDDFFTAAVGHAAELGFQKAGPLLAWKAKFPVERMVGAGVCWIDAPEYSMIVRACATSPFFSTQQEVYAASHTAAFNLLPCGSQLMATSLGLKVGEMTGYSTSTGGSQNHLQAALAVSAPAVSNGAQAWKLFMSRSVKTDYSAEPQFDIVPRN